MEGIKIGKRLKELRKAKDMTLAELSKASGVEVATLSRMEHDKRVGSVQSHALIAYALGIDLSEFYQGIGKEAEKPRADLQKKSTDTILYGKKSSYELLTSNVSSKSMFPTLIKIEPEGKTDVEKAKNLSEGFVYALKGSVEAYIEGEKYNLQEGTSLYFKANQKHHFKNTGKSKAQLIYVRTQ